jgi:hypothetical protein
MDARTNPKKIVSERIHHLSVGSFRERDPPGGDRATAPIEDIWCEKIRGCVASDMRSIRSEPAGQFPGFCYPHVTPGARHDVKRCRKCLW